MTDPWPRRFELVARTCVAAAGVLVVVGLLLPLTIQLPPLLGATRPAGFTLLYRVSRLGFGASVVVSLLLAVAVVLVVAPRVCRTQDLTAGDRQILMAAGIVAAVAMVMALVLIAVGAGLGGWQAARVSGFGAWDRSAGGIIRWDAMLPAACAVWLARLSLRSAPAASD